MNPSEDTPHSNFWIHWKSKLSSLSPPSNAGNESSPSYSYNINSNYANRSQKNSKDRPKNGSKKSATSNRKFPLKTPNGPTKSNLSYEALNDTTHSSPLEAEMEKFMEDLLISFERHKKSFVSPVNHRFHEQPNIDSIENDSFNQLMVEIVMKLPNEAKFNQQRFKIFQLICSLYSSPSSNIENQSHSHHIHQSKYEDEASSKLNDLEKDDHKNSNSSTSSPSKLHSAILQWNRESLSIVVNWHVECITQGQQDMKNQLVIYDALKALSFLLFENSPLYISTFPSLVPMLLNLCDRKKTLDKELIRLSFNCLANLCPYSTLNSNFNPHLNVNKQHQQNSHYNPSSSSYTAQGNSNQVHFSLNHLKIFFDQIFNLATGELNFMFQSIQNNPSESRLMASVLRTLQLLIYESKNSQEGFLASLISQLSKLIFFGTNQFPITNLPKNSHSKEQQLSKKAITKSIENAEDNGLSDDDKTPDDEDHDIESPKQSNQTDPDAIECKQNQNIASVSSSFAASGSDYSGSDAQFDTYCTWKVRFRSIGCLQSIIQASSSKFVQFWPIFLPQSQYQPSLISILQTDPVHQVRSSSCRLLSLIFEGQQEYLASIRSIKQKPSQSPTSNPNLNLIHSSSSKSSSFTPQSLKVTQMVNQIQLGLLNSLLQETRQSTVISILKTISSISQQISHPLSPSNGDTFIVQVLNLLKTKIFQFEKSHHKIHPFQHLSEQSTIIIQSNDCKLLKTYFSTFSSLILDKKLSSKESFEILTSSPSLSNINLKLNENDFVSSDNLVSLTVKLALSTGNPTSNFPDSKIFIFCPSINSSLLTSLHIENLKLISSISIIHLGLVLDHWKELFNHCLQFFSSFKDCDPNLRLTSLKLIDDTAKSILDSLSKLGNFRMEEAKIVDIWNQILESKLVDLCVKDRYALVRTTSCHLMSQMPPFYFHQLDHRRQNMCVTLLLGASKDDNATVRAQACRSLGIYIWNHSIKLDPLFVIDVATALIESMKDKNMNVRIKAVWAAANLCDSIVSIIFNQQSHQEGNDDKNLTLDPKPTSTESKQYSTLSSVQNIMNEIPEETVYNLGRSLLASCKDNDKVRCNSVRALGNFLRFYGTSNASTDSSSAPDSNSSSSSSKSQLMNSIVTTLSNLTSEGSAKVRWNSCYAVANSFLIYHHSAVSHLNWIQKSINSLILALTSSNNYKVRINACFAIQIAVDSNSLTYDFLRTTLASIVNNAENLFMDKSSSNLDEKQDNTNNVNDRNYKSMLTNSITKLFASILSHPSLSKDTIPNSSSSKIPIQSILELVGHKYPIIVQNLEFCLKELQNKIMTDIAPDDSHTLGIASHSSTIDSNHFGDDEAQADLEDQLFSNHAQLSSSSSSESEMISRLKHAISLLSQQQS